MKEKISAIILAGGYGFFTGLGGAKISKVIARLNGEPMVRHIVKNLIATGMFDRYYVVINSTYGDQIRAVLSDLKNIIYVVQPHRLGTAGAVELVLPYMCAGDKHGIITYADMAVWPEQTYCTIVRKHLEIEPHLTTVTIPLVPGTRVERYGRVIYSVNGEYLGTVDDPNYVPEGQFTLAHKVNPSLYVGNIQWLTLALPHLPWFDKKDGNPPEKLMQSVIPYAHEHGANILEVHVTDYEQALGVNTKKELKEVREVYARRSQALTAL